MKKFCKFIPVLLLLLIYVTPVWAHGGEDGEVDAPTLVKQAVAFLDGIEDFEAADVRIQEVLEKKDSSLDATKLEEALRAIENNDPEAAKNALIYALGGDPETTQELALHPKFTGGLTGYAVIFISILLIIGGTLILLSRKGSRKAGVNHEKMA